MVVQTKHHPLDSELTLRDAAPAPLTVRAVAFALTQHDDQLIACCLTLQVNPHLYPRIDTDALFNLNPALRHPRTAVAFLPAPDITIETSLKPDVLHN